MSNEIPSHAIGNAAIASYVREYHPEIIADALRAYQERRVAQVQQMREKKHALAVARVLADAEKLNERLTKLGVAPFSAHPLAAVLIPTTADPEVQEAQPGEVASSIHL